MKERSILFSAAMVRALLQGTKTQTRRIVRVPEIISPDPTEYDSASEAAGDVTVRRHALPDGGTGFHGWMTEYPEEGAINVVNPYGDTGDRLWVREAWRAGASWDHMPPRLIEDSQPVRFVADEMVGAEAGFGRKRPGIFMPRWASRITLEVADVSVERLQDISETDAQAEGIYEWMADLARDPKITGADVDAMHIQHGTGPRAVYAALWESINGTESWEANPWVWVVHFKRISP